MNNLTPKTANQTCARLARSLARSPAEKKNGGSEQPAISPVMSQETSPADSISDACIFIDLNESASAPAWMTNRTNSSMSSAFALSAFQDELLNSLLELGVQGEKTAGGFHLSIGYVESSVTWQRIERVIAAIEMIAGSLSIRASGAGFQILEGVKAPYDYVAIEVRPNEGLNQALAVTESWLPVRRFKDGFRAHISLLRVPRIAWGEAEKKMFLRELNASCQAAFLMGWAPSWDAKSITVSHSRTFQVCCRRNLSGSQPSGKKEGPIARV